MLHESNKFARNIPHIRSHKLQPHFMKQSGQTVISQSEYIVWHAMTTDNRNSTKNAHQLISTETTDSNRNKTPIIITGIRAEETNTLVNGKC